MAINPFRKGGNDTIPVSEGGTGATDAATARANLGAGDLDAAAHAAINHAGLPGVPGSLMVDFFTATWTNSTSTYNTGALSFTPKFIIVNGISSHLNSGANDIVFSGQLCSVFSGIAISGSNGDAGVVTAQQHNSGNANDSASAINSANDWVAGNPAAGDVLATAATTSFVRRLRVDAFSSSGISLTPEGGAFTGRAFILVVGEG